MSVVRLKTFLGEDVGVGIDFINGIMVLTLSVRQSMHGHLTDSMVVNEGRRDDQQMKQLM